MGGGQNITEPARLLGLPAPLDAPTENIEAGPMIWRLVQSITSKKVSKAICWKPRRWPKIGDDVLLMTFNGFE